MAEPDARPRAVFIRRGRGRLVGWRLAIVWLALLAFCLGTYAAMGMLIVAIVS